MVKRVFESIFLGDWSKEEIDCLLKKFSRLRQSKKIALLCERFLNTPYKDSTLIGNKEVPEVFVINLKYVDCFTFIDYIEALRRSKSFLDFKENLKTVRYKKGKISFKNRNHFFSDWGVYNKDRIKDVTEEIGDKKVIKTKKVLNDKGDGTFFLDGIKCKRRIVTFIPVNYINSIIKRLKTGDYIGIYSEKKGLDVSHVGIYIKERGKGLFFHASSKKGKVIKEDFIDYLKDKRGIIVLRPL
jgi:CRISPR/Cas system-associated endoribonuclease Cas2